MVISMSAKASTSNLKKRIKSLENDLAEYRSVKEEQQMLMEVLQLVNEIKTVEELLHSFLLWMKKYSGCEAVGIRLRDGEDFPYYETSGFPDRFVMLEKNLCVYKEDGNLKRDENSRPVIECMCGNIICGRFDPSNSRKICLALCHRYWLISVRLNRFS